MQIITDPGIPTVNICGYGDSGCGKTKLFTSLPWSTKDVPTRWGEKAVYVATDPGSEALMSVSLEDRKHLLVVKPSLRRDAKGNVHDDPHTEAIEIATYPWRKEYPEVGTIIWDTGNQTAEKMLRAYANTGVFSGGSNDKHITVGEKGKPSYMALPMMGDYMAAQNAVQHLLDFLFQSGLNVILLCHSDIYQPEGGGGETMVGGPGTVGGKAINRVAGKFDYLFRIEAKTSTLPGKDGRPETKTKYLVHTQKKGIWIAKFRAPGPINPLPEFDITGDPSKFWREFDHVTIPEEQRAAA